MCKPVEPQLPDVVYLRIMEYLRPINPTLQKNMLVELWKYTT